MILLDDSTTLPATGRRTSQSPLSTANLPRHPTGRLPRHMLTSLTLAHPLRPSAGSQPLIGEWHGARLAKLPTAEKLLASMTAAAK